MQVSVLQVTESWVGAGYKASFSEQRGYNISLMPRPDPLMRSGEPSRISWVSVGFCD